MSGQIHLDLFLIIICDYFFIYQASISVGVGDSVLDWRATNYTLDFPPTAKRNQDKHVMTTSGKITEGELDFLPAVLSATDYSTLWESMGTVLTSEYTFSVSSSLGDEDMLHVIVQHFTKCGFGIAASGVRDRTLTAFCYAMCESSKSVTHTFLLQIELARSTEESTVEGKVSFSSISFSHQCY